MIQFQKSYRMIMMIKIIIMVIKKTVGCNITIMSHEDKIKSDNVEYGITTNDKEMIRRERNVNNGDDDEDDEDGAANDDDDMNMSVVSSIDSYTSSIPDVIVSISNSYVGIELSDGRSSSSVVVDDVVVDHDGLEDEDVLVSSEESDYEKDNDDDDDDCDDDDDDCDDDDCDDEKEVEDKFSEMVSDDLSVDSHVISYR